MVDGLLALKLSKMFARRAFRVAVGVTGRDVEAVEEAQPILDFTWRCRVEPLRFWDGIPEPRQGMPPPLLPNRQVESFQRLLRSLVSGETGPFMPRTVGRLPCLLQIPQGLVKPVLGTVGQGKGQGEQARTIVIPIALPWGLAPVHPSATIRRATNGSQQHQREPEREQKTRKNGGPASTFLTMKNGRRNRKRSILC